MYDRSVLPPAVMEDVYGLFPMESVLYSFEVKSILTKGELAKAVTNFKVLHQLQYDSWPSHCPNCGVNYKLLVPTLFAFDLGGGLNAGNLVDQVMSLHNEKESALGAICVVGHGYWIWDGETKSWLTLNIKYAYEEVTSLLGGVMNTYQGIAQSRHVQFPLGHYILDGSFSRKATST